MTTLTIGIRQLRDLVTPVMPFASTDYNLPVLNAVQITTSGKWIVATATDRFRLIMHRSVSPDGSWPTWSAIIPTSTLRNILSTFKPLHGLDADLTLTVDDLTLRVAAVGLMDMNEASIAYRLADGKYPGISSIITKALATEVTDAQVGLNPALLKDLPKTALALRFKFTSPRDPVLFTDSENLVGCIMPRRLVSEESTGPFVSLDDAWMSQILEVAAADEQVA